MSERRGQWIVLSGGRKADVDAVLARQRRSDRDLWVLKDRQGRQLEGGLAG